MPDVPITIDEGTILLVAEILRHERRQQTRLFRAAREEIFDAVERLKQIPENHGAEE